MIQGRTLARTPNELHAGAEQESIAHWLLHGPAQVESGAHAGSVAGAIDAAGRAVYAYPEITGYYLQWLAWRAARHGVSPELAARAAAAQQWLARWITPRGPLPTRIHLDGGNEDWRNTAVFCFDLAMVVRGVGTAARVRLIEPDAVMVAGVCAQLESLIGADGLFEACVPQPGCAAPQPRWSTQRGAFLAKATAGILSAAASLPFVPETVRAAAARTTRAALRWAVESPHDDVHALLYTFEGILSLTDDEVLPLLPALAVQFDALLEDARTLGRVPESRRQGAAIDRPERLDVLAQTIRIGHLLGARGAQTPPDQIGLTRLRQILVAHIRPKGAVPFAAPPCPALPNVWAAMFAEQALAFATRVDGPHSVSDLGRLLV
jgi:hypothetical protein